MENIPDTPEGIILESLLEGLNQYYSAELSLKVKRGMRENRIKGNYSGGLRPYGYQVKDRKLAIDEKEAKIIRFIFKQYLLGHRCTQIAKKLRRRSVRYSTNKLITDGNVLKIIGKEYYTGVYKYNGESFYNIYPPIIPRNVFKKAELLRHTYNVGGNVKELYIYRFKLYCKKCGAYYLSDGGTSRHKNIYKYYKCINKKRYHSCDSKAYLKNNLEDYLTSYLKEFILKHYNMDLVSKILIKKFKEKKNLEQLKKFEEEKKECQTSLQNLVQAVENGVFNKSTNDRIKFFESRISELDADIHLEKSKDNDKYSKPYIRKFFLDSLKLEDFEFVNYIVNKIYIDDDTVDIYLNCPYGNDYSTFDLIRKEQYSRSYEHGKDYLTIEKIISIFI